MLKVENIYKSFNRGTDYENQIFNGFDLEIEANTSTALIGSNGCGKSTLLNLIAGSIQLDNGAIYLDGEEISSLAEDKRSKYLGRVYQDPSKGVSPSLSILENMALADNKNGKFNLGGLIRKDRIDYYRSILKTLDLGLEDMLTSKVSLLSGGQRQSLSLIMASMKNPKLLLLDEHTASLDPKTSKVVMEKTKQLIEHTDMTTIMITHNMRDAVEYSDRIIMLNQGQIVLDEKTENISEADLEGLYKLNELVA